MRMGIKLKVKEEQKLSPAAIKRHQDLINREVRSPLKSRIYSSCYRCVNNKDKSQPSCNVIPPNASLEEVENIKYHMTLQCAGGECPYFYPEKKS